MPLKIKKINIYFYFNGYIHAETADLNENEWMNFSVHYSDDFRAFFFFNNNIYTSLTMAEFSHRYF